VALSRWRNPQEAARTTGTGQEGDTVNDHEHDHPSDPAGILAPVGFVLPMAVGAGLMSLSTIIVALNAQFLRNIDLQPDAVR
jgi:hypothetical protein